MLYSGKIPKNWSGDGIVSFVGHHPSLLDFVMDAKSRGIPVVELSLVRADIDLPRVAADNEMIGRLAADHYPLEPRRSDTPSVPSTISRAFPRPRQRSTWGSRTLTRHHYKRWTALLPGTTSAVQYLETALGPMDFLC